MAWNHKTRVVAFAACFQPVAGTYVAPTAADIIPVSVPTNGEDLISTEDPTATGSVWAAPRIFLGKTGNAGATAALRGPGGSVPFSAGAWPLGRILQAAGFAEVITPTAITGVLQAGSSTTSLVLGSGLSAVDDYYIGMPVQNANIGSGAVKGTSIITDYVGSTKAAAIAETLGVAPAAGAAFSIPANVTYQLGTLSSAPPLLSVSVWRDKKRYNYKDVRIQSLTIDMPVASEASSGFPSVEFSLKGLVQSVVDESTPALTSAQLSVIAPFRNGKFMLDRVALGHANTNFQISAEVAGASNAWQPSGQDQYDIMSGSRSFTLDLNQMGVSDFDIDTRVDNQTTVSSMSLWGMGPGNRFGFCVPEVVLDPLNNPGDRNGFVNLTGNAAFKGVEKSATLTIWWDNTGGTVLNDLTTDTATATAGSPVTINILGATAGSTITGTVPSGLTINSAARTITGTPAAAGSTPISLTETLAGAVNSPKTTSGIALTIGAAAPTPLKVLFVGSSTPDKYFTEYGGTPNSGVTVTTNGTTFSSPSVGLGSITYGNALNTALSRPIQMFDFGVSGSTVKEWDDNLTGKTYRTAAVAAALAAGGVDLVVMVMGYNDAYNDIPTSAADHAARVRSFISKLRTELSAPNLKIVYGMSQNSYVSGASPAHDAAFGYVRAAEIAIANVDTNVYFGAHSWDLSQESDGIHLSQTAYPVHAARLADNTVRALAGTAGEKGPRITGVTGLTYTTTEITLTHELGNDFTPTSGYSGFVVTAGATTLAVSSLTRTAANKILLVHDSNAGTPVSVSYQASARGDRTTPIRDNSMHGGYGLPPSHVVTPITAASAGTPPSATKTAIVDFTRTGQSSGSYAVTINRFETATTPLTAGQINLALLDTGNTATGWSITNVNAFDISLTGYDGGSNTIFTPESRLSNGNIAYGTAGNVRFSGLDPAKTYEITCYGSRAGTGTRQTNYSVVGANTVSRVLTNAYNNAATNTVMTGCQPTSGGVLDLTFAANSSASAYGYLNDLQIKEL